MTNQPFRHFTLFLPLLLSPFLTISASAETYSLQVPGNPALKSTAIVEGKTLVIVDGQGQRFDYLRQPQLDTPDGLYLGFHSPKANQQLRWPVNGQGGFYIKPSPVAPWQASRMRIIPRGRPAIPLPNPNPGPFDPNPLNPQPGVGLGVGLPGNDFTSKAITPALLELGPQSLLAAYVSGQGRLQVSRGWGQQWTHQNYNVQGLVPGAPLVLGKVGGTPVPLAWTIDQNGRLLQIPFGNQQPTPLLRDVQFVPGGQLALVNSPGGSALFSVDAQGRIIEFNPVRQNAAFIERQTGMFLPGSPLGILNGQGIFLIDRRGNLVEYEFAQSRWLGPQIVHQGFLPGAHVVVKNGGPGLPVTVAAIDRRGIVQLLTSQAGRWNSQPLRGIQLPPAAAFDLLPGSNGWRVTAVGREGNWNEWAAQNGRWLPAPIASGFPAGAPVLYHAGNGISPHAFAVDASGQLLVSDYHQNDWRSHLLLPNSRFAPRLVSRRVVPGTRLPPAKVFLANTTQEDLLVQISDPSQPLGNQDLKIRPGQRQPLTVERDAGGVIEEIYAVPNPAGFPGDFIEKVRRFPLPPAPLQTVVVYSNRTTYQYIDRRKNKPDIAVPDFDLQSPVSIGVFDLPPGNLLRSGTVIDVYREAKLNRNPGAVRHFPPPVLP